MTGSFRSVELSVGVYKALIRAYPASFRRQYGSEMILVFREHLTDTRRKRGVVGLTAAWFRVLGDLARTVPEEHFREIQRSFEMRSLALALLSAVLAAVVFFTMTFGGFLGMAWLIVGMGGHGLLPILLAIWYLSALLTGLILTRVKPFFAPMVTAPLAVMTLMAFWTFGWSTPVVYIGRVISMGFASLLGCVVAAKASSRLARLSVRWYQFVGPLAVLVCTSLVACVLRMMIMACQINTDLQRASVFCLFALLVISAVMIANIVLLFVRSYRKATTREP